MLSHCMGVRFEEGNLLCISSSSTSLNDMSLILIFVAMLFVHNMHQLYISIYAYTKLLVKNISYVSFKCFMGILLIVAH